VRVVVDWDGTVTVRDSLLMVVAADRVFARAGLAEYLHAEGVACEASETSCDVAAALT
jgi:hypothetical protein